MAFSFKQYLADPASAGPMRTYNNGDLTTPASAPTMEKYYGQAPQPAPSPAGSGDYAKSNQEYEALLSKYQQGIDVTNPDSIRQLAQKMQADGVPAEVSSDGLLIRVPGYDGGWVDPRQDKAYAEGRGGIRGWAFQPYYGGEDFKRLVAEGRNPHTGEMALPGQQFSRDQDAPISGPGAQPGGLPPGYSLQGRNSLASFDAPGLMAPWTQEFKGPQGMDDPGLQYAYDQSQKAMENSAAARGTLLTGGLQRDLAQERTGMALQGWDQAWNRDFDKYQLDRGTFWGNQQNTFGRLNNLASLGLGAATSYSGNQTGLITDQGQANANTTIAQNNNNNQMRTNVGTAVPSVWDAISPAFRRDKPSATAGTYNPGGYSA